jgi:hypothetical protein
MFLLEDEVPPLWPTYILFEKMGATNMRLKCDGIGNNL